jgi:hypothetical protein
LAWIIYPQNYFVVKLGCGEGKKLSYLGGPTSTKGIKRVAVGIAMKSTMTPLYWQLIWWTWSISMGAGAYENSRIMILGVDSKRKREKIRTILTILCRPNQPRTKRRVFSMS